MRPVTRQPQFFSQDDDSLKSFRKGSCLEFFDGYRAQSRDEIFLTVLAYEVVPQSRGLASTGFFRAVDDLKSTVMSSALTFAVKRRLYDTRGCLAPIVKVYRDHNQIPGTPTAMRKRYRSFFF